MSLYQGIVLAIGGLVIVWAGLFADAPLPPPLKIIVVVLGLAAVALGGLLAWYYRPMQKS